MDDSRKPRTDLVEDDPFSRSVRPTSHSRVRDDGNWRAQAPRVVQVQFSPFSRGFTQSYRPAPTLHTGSFWHFSRTEIKDLTISLAAFSLGLSFVFNGGILGGMLSLGSALLISIPLYFVLATIAFGPAFIIHELAHKFVARHYGCWAEFRADPAGLKTGVAIAFIIGFLFMGKTNWIKGLRFNIHAPGTGAALMVLALTQIPVAIKTAAEIACIGEVSNKLLKETRSHRGVNVIAVKKCNGG